MHNNVMVMQLTNILLLSKKKLKQLNNVRKTKRIAITVAKIC